MAARVLILAATTAYQVDDIAAAARRLGIEPLLGSDRCHVLADVWPAGALALDFRQPERAAGQVLEAVADRPIAGVVATDEKTALIAALVASRLGLPHGSVAAARAASNKARFRGALRAAGLPQPAGEIVPAGADPGPAAERAGYPVVLKPLHLSASRGVMRADNPAELAARAGRLARLLADPAVAAIDPDAAGHMIVEQFVPGPELAFEGLMARGRLHPLALFDKPDPLDGPFFAETIYVTPSRLSSGEQARVVEAVTSAAAAIGLDEGPVHAELRQPRDRPPVVLELAARSIGGLCGRVLRFGAGISLEEVVVAHAVGLDPGSLTRSGEPAGGVMMLPVHEPGVLVEVAGVDRARAVPGVRDLVITVRVGENLVPLPEGHSYAGFLFAAGDSPEEVVASLRAAAARLHFHTRPLLG
ncbi:MAG TPA: ATP-grasp domain-containing protein [Kofleriaceae bacterium]|nr:ATP-grasp domain-containing protein [Kofleriaceae bacterium]